MVPSASFSGRQPFFAARLAALGLEVERQPFSTEGGLSGHNLIVRVSGPAKAPLLLIGAHYDRVATGQGATDNASGSAAVLELAEAFKKRPLAGHRVAVAFWDLEEHGLLGSKHWVATAGKRPALYINFDVFGWGDTIWLMSRPNTAGFADQLASRAAAAGLNSSVGESYPPTDHLAFLSAALPAVSFSLVEGPEIEQIQKIFAGEQPAETPKVMRVIHTPEDGLQHLEPGDVEQALAVIEAAIRAWDAQARGG